MKVFEMAPETLQLYPFKDATDDEYIAKLKTHASTMFRTLDRVITGWGTRETDQFLTELGQRHVGYSVIEAHFDIIGESLLETF
mmetsp:Transcript_25634/g.39448  ORF Transcript_25634/g.39448 Transcript_25634/m.39448 type:complete len:84 (+) Transcript_25634:101-352(+)